jgi:hypothetical protein
MATEVDRLVVVFDANFKALDDKLNKVLQKQEQVRKKIEDGWKHTAVGSGLEDAIKRITASANELPIVGAALEALGPAGMAAAVGVGAFIATLEAGRKAIEFGAEIGDVAEKLHISTDALQEFRFVVEQTGGTSQDADASLKSFQSTLGLAALGAQKAVRAFNALHLDPKALSAEGTAKAMDDTIAALGKVENAAERAALAQKTGADAFLAASHLSVEGYNELKQAAHDAGAVMGTELVEQSKEAGDKLKMLETGVKTQLASAFVQLAPLILKVAEYLAIAAGSVADLAEMFMKTPGAVNGWLKKLDDMSAKLEEMLPWLKSVEDFLNNTNRAVAGAGAQQHAANAAVDPIQRALDELGARAAKRKAAWDKLLAQKPGEAGAQAGVDPGSLARTKTASAPSDKTAEFDKSAMAAYDNSVKDLTAAQLALAVSLEERVTLEKQAVADDTQKKLDDLDAEEAKINAALNDKKKKTLDAHSAEQIARLEMARIAVRQAAVDRNILIDRQAEATALQQRLGHEQAATDLQAAALKGQADHLSALASLAHTTTERNRLEQEAMEARQAADAIATDATLQRAKQELEAANQIPDNAEAIQTAIEKVAAAQQAVNAQRTKSADDKAALAFAQEGPIQKYQESLENLNDTMAQAGVQAAQALSDGLADAIVNAKSLGDVASNVFKQLIQQILSAEIQKNIAAPILTALGLPAHAAGTLSSAAGLALVGEQGPEVVRLPGGSQVIPNSALRNIGLASKNGGGTTITFDNRGAVIWEQAAKQLMAYADRAAMGAGGMAVATARRATPSDLARSGSRRLQ